jgi:hypothetical protein
MSKSTLKLFSVFNTDQGSEMGWAFSSDKGYKKFIWSFGKPSFGIQLGRHTEMGFKRNTLLG